MKILNSILFTAFIIGAFISCNKEDDNLPDDISNAIYLEIDPEFNSYIDESGKQYYSNVFASKNDTTVYRLKVENGETYHIYCMQPTVQNSHIEMILFNQDMDTITWSSYYQDGHRILYQNNSDGEVYLKVFIKGPVTESLAYNLYFEVLKSKSVDFAGYNWDGTGLWIKESEDALKFYCNNTLKYRWMRLNEDFQDSPDISFTIKSHGNDEFNPVGFVIAGSSNLLKWGDYQEELPDYGYFFNLTSEKRFSVLDIQGDGISFSYGDLNIPDIDMIEGINFRVEYFTDSYTPHYAVYINDVHVKGFSTTYVQKFYLVVEDKGLSELSIENFKIIPME